MAAFAVLPLPAADILWADLRLGDVPFPLEVPGHGDTIDERARIKEAVYAGLERHGLVNGREPVARLTGALELLARPEVSVDVVARVGAAGGGALRAVTAVRGRRAVRAVQHEQSVELTEVRDTAVIESVVELLPPQRPGPGRSVTFPVSALWRGGAAANTADLQLVQSIMERPVRRAGQLGVLLRDELGVRRLPGLAWFDTEAGRYLTTVTRGRDGEDWTTLSPADSTRLSHRLVEMLSAASRR